MMHMWETRTDSNRHEECNEDSTRQVRSHEARGTQENQDGMKRMTGMQTKEIAP
jgi:hypothetical protein